MTTDEVISMLAASISRMTRSFQAAGLAPPTTILVPEDTAMILRSIKPSWTFQSTPQPKRHENYCATISGVEIHSSN